MRSPFIGALRTQWAKESDERAYDWRLGVRVRRRVLRSRRSPVHRQNRRMLRAVEVQLDGLGETHRASSELMSMDVEGSKPA